MKLNKWFKKYPYPGWLVVIVCMLAASLTTYHFEKKHFSLRHLSSEVQHDFQAKQNEIFAAYSNGLFQRYLKDTEFVLSSKDYYFFILKDSATYYWNTTSFDLPDRITNNPESFKEGEIYQLNNGFYFIQSWPLASVSIKSKSKYTALTIIPISYNYSIENRYFKTHFVADGKIPASTEILNTKVKGAFEIRDREHKPAFYLHFTQAEDEYYVAGLWTWLFAIFTCLSIVFWIHEFCYGIGLRTNKPELGFYVLVIIIAPIAYSLRYAVFPVGFRNSMVFSPELYFCSKIVHSLGELLIIVLLESWMFLYLLSYVPLRGSRFVKRRWLENALRIVLGALLFGYMFYYFLKNIMSLVLDSKISFEAGNFSNLNIFTFVGIFTIAAITVKFLIIMAFVNVLLQDVPKRKFWFVLLLSVVAFIMMYVIHGDVFSLYYITVVILSITTTFLIDKFGLPFKKKISYYDLSIASSTYVWFAILCSWVTFEIYYWNYSKELELRKVYAHQQELKDNGFITYKFFGMMKDIGKDTLIYTYFNDLRNGGQQENLSNYINYVYLDEYLSKFNVDLYYYDKDARPIALHDSVDALLIHYSDSVSGNKMNCGLTDVEDVEGGDYIYWVLSPYQFNDGDTLGYIGFVIFADRSYDKGDIRSFFKLHSNPTDQQYFDRYSYAIYHNDKLWTQAGNIIFPSYLSAQLSKQQFKFVDNSIYTSSLLYRSSREEVIKVVYERNVWTNIVSLFSYVLVVLLATCAVLFLVRYLIFYPGRISYIYRNFSFTIRSKVNITILVTVFLALFVVGFVTLSFLSNRYRDTQYKNLQSLMLLYNEYLNNFTSTQSLNVSALGSGALSAYSGLSLKLNNLARDQGADVNIYNTNGSLIASSQLDLLNQGLLSKNMDRTALLALKYNDMNNFIQLDHIGELSYQSLYAPIRDKHGHVIAYMNIPYYASGKELEDEVSNVVVTLVNVYALVFFLSGLCAIFISNSIIRSFRLLIDQFRNIRLRHNEYIEWPYRDEIALLVNEYNSMMRKVETMARRLVKTEREAAWRDIARQVAHEIKNPLTPMKLNIQYLQQAIATNRPDIEILASRVSNILIEQIENLNVIASEFSNFAKMPEAVPEILNVWDSLNTLIELFQKNNDNVNITLSDEDKALTVYMDKSYFIRVFTNLIQNAIQAIAAGEVGKVALSVEQNDDSVVISVTDNGSGIAKELQDKLFQPYFTTKSSGTGLGLPMTKSLIEGSEGSIWFETKEGEGTTFYVKLPTGEY